MADKNQQQVATPKQPEASKVDALYSWLSYDLQKLKKELLNEVKTASSQTSESATNASKMVTQEIKYSYIQNQTIYDGLAELISGDVEERKKAMEELKATIDEILPQYQATAQEVKYSFIQQQSIYDTIMEKVEKLENIDAMLAELDRKSAEILSLVEDADYKALIETLSEKTEESVAMHSREVLDAVAAIPVAENVDYTRIVDEVGDRVLELLGEVMQASSADKVEAKIDYDKVIYGTAEKVVESLPITEKIDYARIEEMLEKKAEIDYDRLSDMIVAKMAANTAQTYDVKLDEESIDKIADKVLEKMNACEKAEEEVTYDFVIDEDGIESIADRVAEKLKGQTFVAPVEEPAEEVVEEVAEVVEEPVVEEVVEEPVVEEIAPAAEPTYDEVGGELVDADTGLVVRLKKSFTAKMKQSEDNVKGYYSAIKNALKSYKRINSNVSWHGDRFNLGRDTIAKMNICGKTLCLYLALNPEDEELKQSVYHQKNVGEQKAYESTPFMVKVKSDGAAKKAVRLVGILAEKLEAQKEEDYVETDFAAEFAYASIKELLDEGYIKLTKEKKVDLNF
ncbi:MAG: hypothetical protein IJ996_00010 [Clostridia bacterium]|nr:hypothetical protein [Clostridia bacterium]